MRLRTRGRFSIKRIARVLSDRFYGTDFDRALRDAQHTGRNQFVFCWNRGLGDVALGLVPLFARIRACVPGARIVVFTRPDLEDAFRLARVDGLHLLTGLVRGAPIDAAQVVGNASAAIARDALVFTDPDPTRWLEGRRQEFPPSLRWDDGWNALADRFLPASGGELIIGAHVNSETAQHYGYIKDWPATSWQALFARFPDAANVRWVLFGCVATPAFVHDNVIDLRGRTTFLELLAIIRARCRILVAPDSGVLTAAYYLAQNFPLNIVSLWSDSRQGILKQACPSPNVELRHNALLGPDEDVRKLTIDTVETAINSAIRSAATSPSLPPADAHRF